MHRFPFQSRCGLRLVSPIVLLVAVVVGVCLAGDKDDLLVIVQNGRYGFIDHTGKIIIPPQYYWADGFSGGFGAVFICGRLASIDASGDLFPFRFAEEGELEPLSQGEKKGFVGADGTFKIAPTFDDAMPFSEGLAAVRVDHEWGFIDTSGNMVIQPKFDQGSIFFEGVSVVELNSAHLLIDTEGEVIASGYEDMDVVIANGRVAALKDGKWSYLDLRDEVAIPFIYDGARTFSGGVAAIELDERLGYIDTNGKEIIPFVFEEAGPFGNDLAPAKRDGKTGFISRSGGFAFYLPFVDSPGFLFASDVSPTWPEDRTFGCVNASGKVIWWPMEQMPDHTPIFGWSDSDRVQSCENVPEPLKTKVLSFPGQ